MKKSNSGFTLLEVLVALAVAAIGLAGVIKVAGGNAYNAQYLQQKTLAQWVAMNRIAELRARHEFPAIGKTKGDMEMAGRKWYWQQETRSPALPLPGIQQELREIEVSVYSDENFKSSSLTSLSTYLAKQ